MKSRVSPSEHVRKLKVWFPFQFTSHGLKMSPSGKVKGNKVPLDLVFWFMSPGVQANTCENH